MIKYYSYIIFLFKLQSSQSNPVCRLIYLRGLAVVNSNIGY